MGRFQHPWLSGRMPRTFGLATPSPAPRNPNVAPSVNLPGVPHYAGTPQNQSEALARSLSEWAAYAARITYDAGPTWTRWSTWSATDLTPERIIGAQRDAISGYPLIWMDMNEQLLSRDSHYAGITQQRIDDVVKGSWRLVSSAPDPIGACVRNFTNEAIAEIDGFDEDLAWLLNCNRYGYAASETVWTTARITFPAPDGRRLGPIEVAVPRSLEMVHPKHFRFDLRTDEPLLWLGSDQVSLRPGKFVFHRGEGEHPITARRGFGWQCVWPSLFRSIGFAGWVSWVERFAQPVPIIKYDGDLATYQEYKSAMSDILNSLGTGKGAIVPENAFKLDNWQVQGGGRANDPHSALADACDAAQSVRVLGATLTAKIGNVGSFAASSAHLEVKYAKEERDARGLWSTLRRDLLRPIVQFNSTAIAAELNSAGYACTPDMVERRVPVGIHRVPREVDPEVAMRITVAAVNELGADVSKASIYYKFDLAEPVDDNDRLAGKAISVPKGGAAVGAVAAANRGIKNQDPAAEAKAAADGGKADDSEDN